MEITNDTLIPDNDHDIWRRFIAGEQAAFASLYEATVDRLFHYGLKFTCDEELVKDCIHDLFIKIYNNRSELPDTDRHIFFMFKVLRNILINAINRNDRTILVAPQELPLHDEFVYDSDNSDEEADGDEVMRNFANLVSSLPPRQKEAITMRYQAGLSYSEIAHRLGINYQSARNLIHRAVEKIRPK